LAGDARAGVIGSSALRETNKIAIRPTASGLPGLKARVDQPFKWGLCMADANAANSVEEQSDRPVVLICTVGGSPQPIATALRLLRPKVVLFLVSDGKADESSRSQVDSTKIEYDRVRGVYGPGLKFVEGCPTTVDILPVPADDPDRTYALCRSHLA